MNCSGKYTPDSFFDIAFKISDGLTFGSDYEKWINDNFPDDAEAINNSIRALLQHDNDYVIGVLSGEIAAAEGEFSPQWQANYQASENPTKMHVEDTPLSENRTDQLGIKGAFLAESGFEHPVAAYTKMIDDFRKRVVESVFYNPKAKRLLEPEFTRGKAERNLLNEVLYRYKIELMNALYAKLHPGEIDHFKDFNTDSDFSNALNKILSDYQIQRKQRDSNNSVFAEYMLLKNFDGLVTSEFKNIIKLKPVYEESIQKGRNMYDYMGGNVEYDDTWGDEFADASDYSSSIVKALLNYFHGRELISGVDDNDKNAIYRDTNKVIGFPTFCNLITRVKEWAETINDENVSEHVQAIVHGDVNTDWAELVKYYINYNKASLTTDELNALRGIRDYLFNDDTAASQLKRMFVSQAKKTVRYRYLTVAPKYNSKTHRVEMTTTELSDRLIDIQNFRFQGNIKNAVLRFRRDPQQFQSLLDDLGIEVTKEGITFNKLLKDGSPLTVTLGTDDSSSKYKTLKVEWQSMSNPQFNDNMILKTIQAILGVPLPKDINVYVADMNGISNLLSAFIDPLAITLFTASKDVIKEESNDPKDLIRFEDGILVTYPFVTNCDKAAQLLSKIFGTTDTNVVRNDKGNALPSYQIISSVYEVKDFIWEIQHKKEDLRNGLHEGGKLTTAFANNFLVRKHKRGEDFKTPIGQIFSRGDISKDNVTKSSNQLSAKEVYHTEVIENFLKRVLAGKSVILQPIVFSDKKTHFLIEYNTDSMFIGDERLDKILTDLVGTYDVDRKIAKSHMLNTIKEVRGDRTRRQLKDMMRRYQKACGFEGKPGWTTVTINSSDLVLKENLKYLRNFLHGINDVDVLRNYFSDVDLNESLDFCKYEINGETHFDVNLTLLHEAEMYLFDANAFTRYWNEQRKQLAKSLKKYKFKFDSFHDPSLSSILSNWSTELDETEWFDKNARTMQAFVAKKDGKITTDLDNADDIKLHPIIEAYMLADGLLSEQFNELLFGATNGFSDKYKGESLEAEEIRHEQAMKVLDLLPDTDPMKKVRIAQEETRHIKRKDQIFIESTAAKLGDQFKRTVLAGAIRTPYTQGLKYGVSSEWLISTVDDAEGYSYNYLGEQAKNDANDGSGDASPYVCIQENESLGDAAVGNIKKTFLNFTDPATGTLFEIKWAEFPVFNANRRGSMENERKYQKMHSVKKISVAQLKGFDISKYYNLSDIKYDDDYDGRKLTYNEYLFRKDGKTGAHYRIDGVTTKIEEVNGELRYVAYVDETLVTKEGKPLMKQNPRIVPIEYVADLDAIFGGRYCEKLDPVSKQLVWSEDNNKIVNNIICNHNLKKHFIAFVVNKSAQKVGPTNVNHRNIFNASMKDVPLKYYEMSSRHAGVQMNADHEIDEAMVSEMSQMISALIQGGFKKGTVNRIYRMIGQIAAENLKRFTKILDNPQSPTFNDDLYIKLGKLFASSFVDGDKDAIGLAEAFVINAAKELKYNSTNNKIPFSSNQVKGIFQATISSTLNKLGIRRKFPGFGGINSPSYEKMQLYSLGDGSYGFFDEAQDFIREQLRKKIASGKASAYWNAENVFSEQMSDPTSGIIDNPFITRLKFDSRFTDFSSNIGIEDTIVIRKIGDTGEGKLIRIRDIKTLDYIKYLLPTGGFEIYKWTNQPRELRQAQDTVKAVVNKKEVTINWTDLDWVRAGYYLTDSKLLTSSLEYLFDDSAQLEIAKEFEQTTRNFAIQQALEGSGINWLEATVSEDIAKILKNTSVKMLQADETEKLENWSSLINRQTENGTFDTKEGLIERRTFLQKSNLPLRWVQSKTQEFGIALDRNKSIEIRTPHALGLTDATIIVGSYSKASGQIIMGRANAKVLGLRKGDCIADIESQKSVFFLERLKGKYKTLLASEADPKTYDAVLYDSDGDTTLVVVGSVQSNIERLKGCNVDKNYTINASSNYEKDDVELFNSAGKSFYINDKGQKVLVVEDESYLQEVLDSNYYSYVRYNYNRYNWKQLLRFLHPKAFDENGLAKSDATIRIGKTTFTADQINNTDLYVELSEAELENHEYKLIRLSEKQYQAFKAQLNYILTRIPAQSMQSFMDVKVETWLDTEMNEVYVPRALTWIQGSDYDIDKDYMMGFGLLPDGTLATLSDLDKDYDAYEVLLLSAPEGKRTFTTRNRMLNEIGFSNDDVKQVRSGKVSVLNKILEKPSSVIIFDSDVSNSDREMIRKLVQRHEDSKRSGKAQVLGLQNTVVRGILEVLRSPSTQVNMSKPISMDNLKSIAKNSTLAKDEKIMTLDNSFTKFMMQEQNMVGREVIGIGAVSLKHFFAASTFMNQQITKMENAIDNNNPSAIVPLLMDIVYDSKIGNQEVLTLANLDFSKLLAKLKQKSTVFGIVTLDPKYKTKANSNLWNSKFVKDDKLQLIEFIEYLDSKSNGTWYAPVDGAFALSELISAATDNAKELILSKINATTKFADVYTYLLSTGKSPAEIADIMMSPIFNIVAYYAQNNLYDSITSNADLENALQFVLNKKALKGVDDKKFLWLITNPTYDQKSSSFVPWVVRQMFKFKDGYVDFTEDKADNFVRRWFLNLPQHKNQNLNVIGQEILEYVQKTYDKRWNDELFDYTDEYKSFVKACYEELSNPESMQSLLDILTEKMDNGDDTEFVEDPDIISFDFLDYNNDAEFDEEYYSDDSISDSFEDFDYSDLSAHNARVYYKYLTEYFLPKEQEIKTLAPSAKDIQNIQALLDNVLPAMKEQQINGQILGINQGLKTDDFGEQNWVRKLENFINQRYMQSKIQVEKKDVPDFEFNLIRFLSDEKYRQKHIQWYESVKSTVNILKNITSVDHFWQMLQTVGVNRSLIERSAAIRIERDLVDKVLKDAKKSSRGISSGWYYKFNAKEFKELQRVVSDSLVLGWVATLKGLSLKVPNGMFYYSSTGENRVKGNVKSTIISIAGNRDRVNTNGKLKPIDFIASFKRLMDEYIIPELIKRGGDNEFLRNLTTGFRKDNLTGQPITFWKLSINLSDSTKSAKLAALYEPIAQAFNRIVDSKLSDFGLDVGDWTIGDIFYLYNIIVHRDSIGGDSFTKLFEELTVANNRTSLVYSYNQFLGELDNGKYRWDKSEKIKSETGNETSVIAYGDFVRVDLRDVRYRCCLTDTAEKKFKISRTKSKDGKAIETITMKNLDNKPDGLAYDLRKQPRSFFILNLPYINNQSIRLWNKSVELQQSKKLTLQGDSREIVSAIVDVVRDIIGVSMPIEVIDNSILQSGIISDLKVEDRMLESPAFLYKGKIYINTDNVSLDAPVHELMHVICAAMKYGSREKKTLYYQLLDSIKKDDKTWSERFGGSDKWNKTLDEWTKDYEDIVVLSDLKEELLVKALSFGFSRRFEEEWGHYKDITSINVGRIVRSIMEDIFKVESTGDLLISDIVNAPLGQLLGVFKSQFNKSNVYNLSETVIPTNQKLARLKKQFLGNRITIEGDC